MQAWKIPLLCTALCASLVTATGADAASLDVHLTHLRPTETVRVAVYGDARTWTEASHPVAARVVAARGVTQTVRIDDLPPGRYAVRVDQAPNRGGGLAEPASFARERHGSSNNKSLHGIPDFERAAVQLGPAGARVSIHLFTSSRD